MAEDTAEYVRQLSEAVNAAMDPLVPQQKRLEAYELCEKFKEGSPHCIACGIEMSNMKYPPVLRHFGLQLLEHCARFRWNTMPVDQKVHFKETIIGLLKHGTLSLIEEQAYIKDGLSRIVVEMIKREWPQQWPTLLEELDQLCQSGESQTELVLLILLRLVEDVVAFQNLPTQRRKDLSQALTKHMSEIMAFLLQLLQQYTCRYKQFLQSNEEQQATLSCRVAQAVLLTLTGYVDWVNCSHIFPEDLSLLKTLYGLLGDSNLKLLAVECLQLIACRKGISAEERRPMVVLFSEDAMSTILNAAKSACSVDMDEVNHVFLKKLCQVLTGLGVQLCALSSKDLEFSMPDNFPSYLQALLSFAQHPSIQVSNMTLVTFLSFIRHENISKDPMMIEFIPQMLKLFTQKLLRLGFPSRDDSPSCAYSRLDFDNDDEFNYFFSTQRAQQMDLIRVATHLYTEQTFHVASEWFNHVSTMPLQWEPGKDKCTPYSPSYLQWDALSCFIDSTMWGIFKSENPLPVPVEKVILLLKSILALQIEDPCIMSFLLSCQSAVYPVIKYAPELLNPIIDKLFSAAVFSLPGQTKKTRTRPVQNLRRHACSALVRMSKDHPELMLPAFDKIYTNVKNLSTDPEQLTQLERTTLDEALILISNMFKNFDRQSALIGEMLQPVAKIWETDNFREAISSAEKFVCYIGLDQLIEEPSETRGYRVVLMYCITSIRACLNRATWPADLKEAESGGFICGHLGNGSPIYRNPCLPHVLPLLENVLTLTRTFNGMWSPEIRDALPPGNNKVYDMQDVDKNQILGVLPISPAPEPLDGFAGKSQALKMQGFLASIHDNCYQILATCCHAVGHEFYTTPGLATQLINSVFTNLQYLPEFRLRPVIRVFMKALVQHCPSEHYNSLLIPILTEFCSYMFARLSNSWDAFKKRAEMSDPSSDKDNQESQEIIEEEMLRYVTREYMELITNCCKKRQASGHEGASTTNGSMMEMSSGGGDEVVMAEAATSASKRNYVKEAEELTELGKCIMSNESLGQNIVMCAYTAMSWMDSTTCLKGANLSYVLFQHLHSTTSLSSEAAIFLYTAILRGLELHGQHEALQSTLIIKALYHYEVLRPNYPNVFDVMLQIPNCERTTLEYFDKTCILEMDPDKPIGAKKKKSDYKALVAGVIGKHVGQEFKKEVHIKNLPPVQKLVKPKPTPVLEEDTAGLTQLFSQ